jgi:nucleotide-binding universal stress UspA family protein
MDRKMKLLIAHDGSDSSAAMLDDLRMAGLPAQAEVVLLTVAEIYLPPMPSYGMVETEFVDNFPFDTKLAETIVERASEQIKIHFPEWVIQKEISSGSPAAEIIKIADRWKPDLILVGSQGLSAFGRFVFGSVSQKVVTEAHCSVRVARGRVQEEPGCPARIIIGVDGSPGSKAAADEVIRRTWPKGSEVLLFTSMDPLPVSKLAELRSIRESKNELAYAQAIEQTLQLPIEAELRAAGLTVSSLVKEGDPKRILIEEAERWGADCIFVGSRGMGRLKRFLLGSVSTAVVARAHCSVEVVRM